MASPMVMVVSGNPEFQKAFANALGPCGLDPIPGTSIGEATAILNRDPISLIFCSDELAGNGLQDLIREASLPPKKAPVVVVSRFDDCERYLRFLHCGAFDYVLYPLRHAEIEWVVRNTPSIEYARP
jgi:DNA-binding NtrC family response regulator